MNNEQTPLTVIATYKHYKDDMYLYLGEAIRKDLVSSAVVLL